VSACLGARWRTHPYRHDHVGVRREVEQQQGLSEEVAQILEVVIVPRSVQCGPYTWSTRSRAHTLINTFTTRHELVNALHSDVRLAKSRAHHHTKLALCVTHVVNTLHHNVHTNTPQNTSHLADLRRRRQFEIVKVDAVPTRALCGTFTPISQCARDQHTHDTLCTHFFGIFCSNSAIRAMCSAAF
jgi:hypothetical protein